MNKVEKIYSLKLVGEQDVVAKMELVDASFNKAKKTFLQLKNSQPKNVIVDPAVLERERQVLIDAEKALLKETAAKTKARAEAQALLKARQLEKNETDKLKSSYSQLDAELEKARKKNKELSLESINLRNAKKLEQNENQKLAQGNGAVANSYNSILAKVKELRNAQKNNLDILNIDDDEIRKSTEELRLLQDRLNAFNRSLSSEGTNVGEYTRGIINAIKTAGLDDIIKEQVDKAKSKLSELDSEFEQISAEIRKVRSTGEAGFESLERKLIENRTEAEKLRSQLNRVQTEIRGMGSVGEQVSKAMGGHFRNLRNDLLNLAVGYVGIQQAMNFAQNIKTKAIEFDSANTAIEAISGNTYEYGINTAYLDRVTEKYGQNLLGLTKSYKSFYAAATQSNISQEDTRMIFESVAEAGGVLKLSQDDMNGALIAFGQIASKGKVQAEELRGQIGERIPGAFAIAARAMNVTQKELNKMMERGELASNDFLPKFARELQRTYSSGQEPIKGLQAEMNRLDNLISKIANNKEFINFIGLTISGLKLLVQTVTAIPWQMWLTFLGLLTAAYWSNVVALGAKTAAVITYVSAQAIGNTLIALATALQAAQTIVTWTLVAAKTALNAILITLGISTVGLNTVWALLNATFLATPVGWIVAGIAAIGIAVVLLGDYIDSTNEGLKEQGEEFRKLAAAKRVNAELDTKATEATSNNIARMSVLTATAKNNAISLETRKKALEDLIAINPKYLSGLNLENIATAEGVKILEAYKKQIIEVARAKAAQAILQDKQAAIIENEMKYSQMQGKILANEGTKTKEVIKDIGALIGVGEGGITTQFLALENKIKQDKEDVEQLVGIVADYYKDGLLEDIVPADNGVDVEDKKEKTPKDDRLKNIDAERDRLLAIEKQRRLKDEIDEEVYLKNVLNINNDAIGKKLEIIKGKNAEERKMIEELRLERLQNEQSTNEEIFNMRKKTLEEMLEFEKNNAKKELETVTDNPRSTEVEKEQAEQDYFTTLIQSQLTFNEQMDFLEKQFTQQSIENEQQRAEALYEIQKDLNNNTYELSEAKFRELLSIIENAKIQAQNLAEINYQDERLKVLKDGKLSDKKREIELDKIYFDNQIQQVTQEIEAQKKLILVYVQKYGILAALNKEVQEAMVLIKQLEGDLAELVIAKNKVGQISVGAPSDQNTQKLATDGIIEGLGLNEGEYGELIGYALAQSFDIATTAMNGYFEAEAARIEKSKELAFTRIDLEKKQLLAQAQSASEREAIERQSAQKKKQAEKEAGERMKKMKKAEAKIAFAMELANIWSTVFQLGPIAGAIMGGVLTALAGVKFAMTMNNIDKAQFGTGGMFGGGGKLDGPSHADNNGMPVVNPKTGDVQAYLEGGEGIVNKRAMADNGVYSVTGTPGQIASRINSIGGGIDFLGGATMKRFARGGSYIGSNVQPPVFSSYFNRSGEYKESNYDSRISNIESLLESTNETLNREVNRKTVVSSREMSRVQDENKKQSEIATLG